MYVVGLVVVGAGLIGATIGTPVVTSTLVPDRLGGTAQGLVAAALNVGGLLSSLYAALVLPRLGGGAAVRPLYLVSAGIALAIAVALGMQGRRQPIGAIRQTSTMIRREPDPARVP